METLKASKITVLLMAVVLLFVGSAKADLQRALDQTINEAAQEAARKLNDTKFEDVKNIAILPLWGECDADTKSYIASTIQSQIIGGPYRVMERDTEAWENLLGEVKWGTLREDIMSQEAVQRFGNIQGCDAIVYGTVRECASYPGTGSAVTRLTLRMGIVETGEAKWSSGEIKMVKIVPQAPKPLPDVDSALVRAINLAAEKAAESLKNRSLNIKGFAFFPLLGKDEDNYVSEVLQSHLTKVGCSPIPVSQMQWQEYLVANSSAPQRVETMRNFSKEKGHSALLYGTVNECRVLERKYKAVARMTLNMVNVETGQSVWSPGEIVGTVWLDWQDIVRLAVSDPIVWVLGSLIVLLIIWRSIKKLFRTATRPR